MIAFTADRYGTLTFLNRELQALTGCTRDDIPKTEWMRAVHPDDRDRVERSVTEAIAAGAPLEVEVRCRLGDGTFRAFMFRATPVGDGTGVASTYAGSASDLDAVKNVEDQLRALVASSDRTRDRERLYANLSEELSGVLSVSETAQIMLRAIIPKFADWMSVYLERRDGSGFEVIAMEHRDERRKPIIEALIGTSFATESSATAHVLRTGESLLFERYPEELRERAILPEYQALLRQLGLRSAIIVPFRYEGKVIGAIHVIRGDNPVDFSPEDLLLVEELARRITPAIHNADAYERERVVAMRFQKAALPSALPQLHGLEFDAIYEAAKTEATVGGDWYDAFRIDDERLLVSVGDVAGHGLEAATIMVALRHSVRAFSLTTTAPNELMYLLRSMLLKDYPGVFATAFIGVYSPECYKLEHASAGHPGPLVRSPNGIVRALTGANNPLLGIPFEKIAVPAETTLEPSSLLVLFTDGLTEATRNVVAGEQRLRSVVGSSDVGNAKRPAQMIHTRMLPEGSFDDTAILTLRILGPGQEPEMSSLG